MHSYMLLQRCDSPPCKMYWVVMKMPILLQTSAAPKMNKNVTPNLEGSWTVLIFMTARYFATTHTPDYQHMLSRSEGAGAERKNSCLLQHHATPNSWLSLYTETHLSFSTSTAAQHSSCSMLLSVCAHVGVWWVQKTPLPIAQSDTNQQHTPWQSVNWYLCAS